MIVKRTDDGEYEVWAQNGIGHLIAGPFPNHAAAWRWIDRNDGQPVSTSEAIGIYSRESNGGIA